MHTFIRIPYHGFCFSDGSLYCTDICSELPILTTILIILCLFSFFVVIVILTMSLFHFTFVFNHNILPDFCL